MKKIPTLYVRDHTTGKINPDQVTPGCEWVTAGQGTPTRKYDGTCVLLDDHGRWWARRTVNTRGTRPAEFITVETDPATGKVVGWVPIEQSPFARWHAEALESVGGFFMFGTYELAGPKINGNPERLDGHRLWRHGAQPILSNSAPLDLIHLCILAGWEGIVWYHRDGRMCKLKVRDLPDPERPAERHTSARAS